MEIFQALDQYNKDNSFRLNKETIRNRSFHIMRFCDYSNKTITQITRRDILSWLTFLTEAELKKPNTIRNYLTSLKSFFTYCVEEKIIYINPTQNIEPPREPKLLPRYLKRDELIQLQEASNQSLRDRAIIDCLYFTGVRASELGDIMIEDLDCENLQIWIRKGKGLKERYVFITPECYERIRVYLESRNDDCPYLFVNQYGRKFLRAKGALLILLKKYAAQTTIKKVVSPHILRHTFATHLFEKGASIDFVGSLLGHKDLKSTRRYVSISEIVSKNTYDKYF